MGRSSKFEIAKRRLSGRFTGVNIDGERSPPDSENTGVFGVAGVSKITFEEFMNYADYFTYN